MNAALQSAAATSDNQDRADVVLLNAGMILVVADGTGGQSGGAEAATMAVELVREAADQLHTPESCVRLLEYVDQRIAACRAAGETTCALAVVRPSRVFGASVGDSGIWRITGGIHTNLTQAQSRKPFLGSGAARALSFDHSITGPTLILLATDGLLKYASAERIIAACCREDPELAASRLIRLVRYPSGALPDDVTVIVGVLP